MSGPKPRFAEIRGDLFRRIARRPGGARGILLGPEVLERAHTNVQRMTPVAMVEIQRIIDEMKARSDDQTSADAVWRGAHDLRGLAGTFGLSEVGAIAGAIRWYGQDAAEDFEPDWAFLKTLVAMLVRAFKVPEEMPVAVVTAACRDAVAAQRAREGRTPGEGGEPDAGGSP